MLLSRMAAELNKKYSGIHAVIPGDCLLSHLLFLGKEGTFQKDALYVIFGERAVFRNSFPRNLLVIYQDDEERHTLEDHLSHCGGLSNLRKRAEEIGAHIRIESAPAFSLTLTYEKREIK